MENFQQPLTFPAINGTVFTELTALTSQSANKIINVILHYQSQSPKNKFSFPVHEINNEKFLRNSQEFLETMSLIQFPK